MARNVFILGAGFSGPAGAPLIYNFIPLARTLFEENSGELKSAGYYEYFENVFLYKDELKQVSATFIEDFNDIEKLYSYSDFECRYIDVTKAETRKSLIFMIVKTIDMLTVKTTAPESFIHSNSPLAKNFERLGDPLPENINIYDAFALLLSGRYTSSTCNSSVITFNYDVILDNACVRWGIKPFYYLPNEKESKLYLKILKLHGSANWMTCSNQECEDKDKLVDVKTTGKFIEEYKTRTCPKCNQQKLMPLLVPPSWDKTQFKEILGNIWNEAGREIKEAKRIFIIGYSFPDVDLYFRYLLYTTLSFNKNDPEIYIIDYAGGYKGVVEKVNKVFNQTFIKRNIHLVERELGRLGTTNFINKFLLSSPTKYF